MNSCRRFSPSYFKKKIKVNNIDIAKLMEDYVLENDLKLIEKINVLNNIQLALKILKSEIEKEEFEPEYISNKLIEIKTSLFVVRKIKNDYLNYYLLNREKEMK